jgi:hypothetical protein
MASLSGFTVHTSPSWYCWRWAALAFCFRSGVCFGFFVFVFWGRAKCRVNGFVHGERNDRDEAKMMMEC